LISAKFKTTNDLGAVHRAAAHGSANAQYNLGRLYANGYGVPQDCTEAAKWYGFAAIRGDVDAQFNLGLLYANGHGVPQDRTEAARWYRLAADQGHADARRNLRKLRNAITKHSASALGNP
jgi:TPR repeat protein